MPPPYSCAAAPWPIPSQLQTSPEANPRFALTLFQQIMRNPDTKPRVSKCATLPVAAIFRNMLAAPYMEEERGRMTSVTSGIPHRIEIMRGLWGSGSQADRVGRNQRKDRDTQDDPILLSSVGKMGSKTDAGSAPPSAVSSWQPQDGPLAPLGPASS